jgi:DNA-3-methyladenine glycosylase II
VPFTWENITYRAFQSVEVLASAGVICLRECKLSTRKAEYILEVARSIHEGYLDLEGLRNLPAEEFEAQIMDLRGVGHWTAHWLLIRALGHPNAFPSGDLALARIISRICERDHTMSPRELEEFSKRWTLYRGGVALYLSAAWRLGLLGTTAKH